MAFVTLKTFHLPGRRFCRRRRRRRRHDRFKLVE